MGSQKSDLIIGDSPYDQAFRKKTVYAVYKSLHERVAESQSKATVQQLIRLYLNTDHIVMNAGIFRKLPVDILIKEAFGIGLRHRISFQLQNNGLRFRIH